MTFLLPLLFPILLLMVYQCPCHKTTMMQRLLPLSICTTSNVFQAVNQESKSVRGWWGRFLHNLVWQGQRCLQRQGTEQVAGGGRGDEAAEIDDWKRKHCICRSLVGPFLFFCHIVTLFLIYLELRHGDVTAVFEDINPGPPIATLLLFALLLPL